MVKIVDKRVIVDLGYKKIAKPYKEIDIENRENHDEVVECYMKKDDISCNVMVDDVNDLGLLERNVIDIGKVDSFYMNPARGYIGPGGGTRVYWDSENGKCIVFGSSPGEKQLHCGTDAEIKHVIDGHFTGTLTRHF